MSMEEKGQSRQDSGRKKDSEYFRLDRQKVSDFFLSIDSGQQETKLTDATEKLKDKEEQKDKNASFFLPE